MAVLKLSQISASGANFTTGDVLIGVQGGTADVGFSLAQIFAAPRSITGTGHTGATIFSVLPDSGASFIKLNDNGSMVIDGDTGTATNPFTVKFNTVNKLRCDFNGWLYLVETGTTGGLNVGSGVVTINPGTALSLFEITAPAGTANTARLFAQDNGAGKTQLMVIFGSGTAIQLAIEV